MRVRVHANDAAEIRQAVELVRELGLTAVLELGDAAEGVFDRDAGLFLVRRH